MMIKGIKPRTHLFIDLSLFALLLIVATSTFLEHTASKGAVHLRFMLHMVHGLAGIGLCIIVAVHLFLHLPWITSQVRRIFQTDPG